MMEQAISVSGLTKLYAGTKAVDDLSVSVSAGEIYGLLGANGAGKSTAIECMLGTKKADKGTVSILGMSPENDRKALFERVGVQFQEANYPEKIKVRELCQETACLYKDPADYKALLKQYGLEGMEKRYVGDLSGGQKQRLFIILALLSKPRVLFLDELTTGLDTRARRGVWKHLIELKKQGLTIFLTSHYMDEVEVLCDRIGILKNGSLVFTGTVQEAIEKSPYENLEDAYLWYSGEEELAYE